MKTIYLNDNGQPAEPRVIEVICVRCKITAKLIDTPERVYQYLCKKCRGE